MFMVRNDSGIFTCRVDFSDSPSKNSDVVLNVYGEFQYHKKITLTWFSMVIVSKNYEVFLPNNEVFFSVSKIYEVVLKVYGEKVSIQLLKNHTQIFINTNVSIQNIHNF